MLNKYCSHFLQCKDIANSFYIIFSIPFSLIQITFYCKYIRKVHSTIPMSLYRLKKGGATIKPLLSLVYTPTGKSFRENLVILFIYLFWNMRKQSKDLYIQYWCLRYILSYFFFISFPFLLIISLIFIPPMSRIFFFIVLKFS